jgi:hypothetical protein
MRPWSAERVGRFSTDWLLGGASDSAIWDGHWRRRGVGLGIGSGSVEEHSAK